MNSILKPTYISNNWVNDETWDFIKNLSFDGYILAGHSVTNMIEKIPLTGDLDFWVQNQEKYLNAFNEMAKHYKNFNLYPSMIEMYNDDNILPRINLIFSSLTTEELLDNFDLPYCKCYWIPNIEYNKMANENTLNIIKTKLVTDEELNSFHEIQNKRILKAINYGYTFTNYFWYHHNNLLKSNKKIDKLPNIINFHKINFEDLNIKEFNLNEIDIIVKDKTNIETTLYEIYEQYMKISLTLNTKLPILLKFTNNEIELIKLYIEKIVLENPLSTSNYLELNFNNLNVDEYLKNKCSNNICLNEKYKLSNKCFSKNKCSDNDCSNNVCSDNDCSDNDCSDNDCSDEEYELPNECFNNNQNILTKKYIKSNDKTQVIQLNNSGTAYILISHLDENLCSYAIDNFYSMWSLHPKQKHKIIMYEKEIEVHRYSQSYLHTWTDLSHINHSSYMYSGFDTSTNNIELPELFMPYYEFMKNTDNKYNQVIANWYGNKGDYIAMHSDCQRGMIDDAKISIVSLYPNLETNNFRFLRVKSKNTSDTIVDEIIIRLDHGSIITMCGTTQDEYRHGINKSTNNVCSRISLSFRQTK